MTHCVQILPRCGFNCTFCESCIFCLIYDPRKSQIWIHGIQSVMQFERYEWALFSMAESFRNKPTDNWVNVWYVIALPIDTHTHKHTPTYNSHYFFLVCVATIWAEKPARAPLHIHTYCTSHTQTHTDKYTRTHTYTWIWKIRKYANLSSIQKK